LDDIANGTAEIGDALFVTANEHFTAGAYDTQGDSFMRAFWMMEALRRRSPHFDPLILSTGEKSDAVETAFMLSETVREHLGAPPPYAGALRWAFG